jgi:hypothetical protein
MMWDGFQREMLAALGHTVFVPAAAKPVEPMPVPMATATDATQPALLHALMRAAGVDAGRLGELPPLDQLHDAAAKRALWPRLRAMRSAARS